MRIRIAAIAATLLLPPLLTACGSDNGVPDETSAAVTCEDFVRDRVESPDTAEFPSVMDEDDKTTTHHDTKPWKFKVIGVVDVPDALGHKIRSDYVCTVSTKDNKNWRLDDMLISVR